ncbi:MAG: T9SS type A sorting domain-containing protein [Crocinitomicaceae bacterium]
MLHLVDQFGLLTLEPKVIYGIRVTFADEVSNQFAPATAVVEVDGSIVAIKAFTVDDQLLGTPQDIFFDNQIQLSGGDQEVYFYIQDNDGELIFATSGNEAYHLGLKWIWDTGGQQYLFINEPAMVSLKMTFIESLDEIVKNNLHSLEQNWPNPCMDKTAIQFILETPENCILEIKDINGKTLKKIPLGSMGGGQHKVELNTSEFSQGMYYYTLIAGDEIHTKKMIISR